MSGWKSGRGGYRGGQKPEAEPHLKRNQAGIRLPQWLIEAVEERAGKEGKGRYIERMLIEKCGFELKSEHGNE